MKCPFCGSEETRVIDKRGTEDFEANRRRRECPKCGKRFTTYERIELPELTVVKKDGRRELFDRKKVEGGLLKACEKRPIAREKINEIVDEIEGELHAQYATEVPSSAIGELVMQKLKALDEVAYIRFASVYKHFTDLESFKRELEALKVVSEPEQPRDSTDFMQLIVTSPITGMAVPWSRERIAKALVRETNMAQEQADEIARAVEKKVFSSGIRTISVSLIRELVNNELFERGLQKKLAKQEILGLSAFNLNNLIYSKSVENSNIVANNPEAVNLAIAETVLKQFALKEVFSPEVAEAHLSGAIYLHDLGYPTRVYSFHKDECMLVKIGGRVGVRSFEQLWNEFNAPIVEENGFEIKPLADYDVMVYDKNKSWTKVKRVVRHKSDKRMRSFESVNGKSVVVTEDHPFVTLPQEIPAHACPSCGSVTKKTNESNAPGSKMFLCTNCGRQFKKRCVKYDLSKTILKPAKEITKNNWLIESDLVDRDAVVKEKVFTPISEELAYLIGLYVSEGCLGKNCVEISGREHIARVEEIIKALGFSYEKKADGVRIWSTPLARFLLEIEAGKGSENKALPRNFLNYDDAVVDAMIAGVFDGAGTIKPPNNGGATEYCIRVSSRLLLSQLKYWLEYRQVRNSLTCIGLTKKRNYRGRVIENKKPLYQIAFYLNNGNSGLLKKSVRNHSFTPSKKTAFHAERLYQPARIKAIKECIYPSDYVYDITTDSGTFVCNGILVHNCSAHSIEYLKKYGLRLLNLSSASSPAKHASTLTGHLNTFLASMQAYYAGALGIAFLNIFYAPLLKGKSFKEMKQEAQYLIFSCSQNAFSRGGQSLVPEEIVWVKEDGLLKQVPIGELVDGQLKKDFVVEQWVDGTQVSRSNLSGIEAICFDEEGRIKTQKITAFARIPFKGKIYSIETSKGAIKGVTGSHSVFVWNGEAFTAKKAEELKEGDYIVAGRRARGLVNESREFDAAGFYLNKKEGGNEVRVFDEEQKFKKQLIARFGKRFYKEFSRISGVKEECVRSNWLRYKKIPLKQFAEFLEPRNEKLVYKGDSQATIPARIRLTREFAKLLAYYASEGHDNARRKTFITISNSSQEFVERVVSCLKALGYPCVVEENPRSKVKTVVVQGILARLVSDLCEEKGVKKIPEIVYSFPLELRHAFLQAFHEGAGLKDRKKYAVASTSRNVVNGIALLLAQEGRAANIFKRKYSNNSRKPIYELREADENSMTIDHKFSRELVGRKGFRKEAANLEADLASLSANAGNAVALQAQRARMLLDADVCFAQVKKITAFDYEGFVYDVSTPPTESFLGGTGLIFFHNTLFIDFNIHFGIPAYLREVPAIGAGGKYLLQHENGEIEYVDEIPRDEKHRVVQPRKGRFLTYGDFEREAQEFARALLEVWREGDVDGKPFAFPKANCHIDAQTFSDPTQFELLKFACEIASENGAPYFIFDREEATLAQCCRLKTKIEDPYLLQHPESIRFCGFQNVTINLPQAAYRAGERVRATGGLPSVDDVIKEILWGMNLAMKAHLEKRKFIQKIMNQPGTPLWQLGMPAFDGRPYLDLDKATYIIGMIGLDECVKYVTGKHLHETKDALKAGLKIISAMYLHAKELEKEHGLKIVLEESPAESASLRMARIDLSRFPEAKEFVRGNQETGEVYYTNSIHLVPDAPVAITERVEKQALFNVLIEAGSITHVFLGEQRPSPESILALVKKTWEHTQSAQIVVSPEFTVCEDCKRVGRGYARNKERRGVCEYCGSENVYGISRVVGYYSRINNWNKSKQAEFRDRQRGNYALPQKTVVTVAR